MALKDRINSDLKAAMLGGNHFASDVYRGLKAVILNEEVSQGKRESGLDDSEIERLVAREVKKRQESALIYDQAKRPELANDERAEAEILSAYLPKQLSEAEINTAIRRIVDKLGASNASMMGQVIGAVKKELGSTADGAIIARLTKDILK